MFVPYTHLQATKRALNKYNFFSFNKNLCIASANNVCQLRDGGGPPAWDEVECWGGIRQTGAKHAPPFFFFPFSFYFESLGVYRCSAKVKHIEWETAEASLLDWPSFDSLFRFISFFRGSIVLTIYGCEMVIGMRTCSFKKRKTAYIFFSLKKRKSNWLVVGPMTLLVDYYNSTLLHRNRYWMPCRLFSSSSS